MVGPSPPLPAVTLGRDENDEPVLRIDAASQTRDGATVTVSLVYPIREGRRLALEMIRQADLAAGWTPRAR